MSARFLLYTDAASAVRVAQLFAANPRREALLAAIRETHPSLREAIDPRPELPFPIAAAPAVAPIVTNPADQTAVS